MKIGISFFVTCLIALCSSVVAEPLSLSLTECIRLGVSRNLHLLNQRLEHDETKFDIEIAKKIFIPEVKFQIDKARNVQDLFEYQSSISGRALDGTKLDLNVAGKTDGVSNVNHSRTYSVVLNRPLLRGFGRRVTGIDVDLNKLDYEIALELFRSEMNSFIAKLADLYYDLYFDLENLRVQEQAYQRAQKQFEDTKHDIEMGVIPEQEIYLVEENVVEFEIKKESAKRDISYTELEIRNLLNLDPGDEISIRASDSLEIRKNETLDFSKSLEILRNCNPNFKIKNLYLRKSQMNTDFYRNQLLPILDFQVEYNFQRGPKNYERDTYNAGFLYEFPLSRSSRDAEFKKSKFEVRKSEVAVQDVETSMGYDLRKLYLDIEFQKNVFQAKGKARELSQKKLDAEMEKYRNGISTLADIVRFQRELENSTIDEIQTQILLNKYYIERLLLEGTLYKEFGIDIAS